MLRVGEENNYFFFLHVNFCNNNEQYMDNYTIDCKIFTLCRTLKL